MIQNIVVCGLGKLGSPIAASFAKAGIKVTGYDVDQQKVDAINGGRAPVQEPGLQEAITEAGKNLSATNDPLVAVRGTQACIFVAPTPSLPDGSFHNLYLLDGMAKIATAVSKHRGGAKKATPKELYTFVVASTVTPGSCDKVLRPAIENHSRGIRLVYKPELIALGSVMANLAKPDVALIGADTPMAADEVAQLYGKIHDCYLRQMTLLEAELAKISLNCAITMKISFANQVGMLAENMGANPQVILDFVGQDSRIGPKCLKYGMPYGGPCFPRDARMFQFTAEQRGIVAHLARATDTVNDDMKRYILSQIPPDGDVGILGLAYKPGAVITDESAGLFLRSTLIRKGLNVKAHDPLIKCQSLEEVLNCRTIIVTMDHPDYRGIHIPSDRRLIDPMRVTNGQP